MTFSHKTLYFFLHLNVFSETLFPLKSKYNLNFEIKSDQILLKLILHSGNKNTLFLDEDREKLVG